MPKKKTATAAPPPGVRDWEHLEQLVTMLLAKLDPNSAVRWDARVPRRHHKGTRQADTVIAGTVGGVPIMIIVNSKHLRRTVEVNRVHELEGVMREVGADRGVIVSTVGFSRKALEAAEDSRITTYVIRPAKDEDWEGLIREVEITGNLIGNVIDEAVVRLEGGEERPMQAHAMWLVSDGPEGERRHFVDHIINGILARPDVTWVPGKRAEFLFLEPIFYDLDGQGRRRVERLLFRARPEVVHRLTMSVRDPHDWVYVRITPRGEGERAFFEFAEINAAVELERTVRAAVDHARCPVPKHAKRRAKIRKFEWQGLQAPKLEFKTCCDEQTRVVAAEIDKALQALAASGLPRPVSPGAVINWKRDPLLLSAGDASAKGKKRTSG
jgi:hypothetical protein